MPKRPHVDVRVSAAPAKPAGVQSGQHVARPPATTSPQRRTSPATSRPEAPRVASTATRTSSTAQRSIPAQPPAKLPQPLSEGRAPGNLAAPGATLVAGTARARSATTALFGDYSYVKHDLRKVALLTVGACVILVVVAIILPQLLGS